jgi:hypothetical protein
MADSWTLSTAPGDLYWAMEVPGYMEDIDVVTWPEGAGGMRYYALLVIGTEGIALVNLAVPALIRLLSTCGVNYEQAGITSTDGGGCMLTARPAAVDPAIPALLLGALVWLGVCRCYDAR